MMFLHVVGLALAAGSALVVVGVLVLIGRFLGWLVRVLTWLGRI